MGNNKLKMLLNSGVHIEKCCSSLLIICLLGLISCEYEDQSPDKFTESLPQVHPQKISQFQKVDSLYFGYLGWQTIAMDDGSVVIPLHKATKLLQVSREGKLIKQVARTGRGPGEVQDLLFIQRTKEGGVLVVDQQNQKIIKFGQDLKLITELTPKPPEASNITGIYPMRADSEYLIRASSGRYLTDESASPSISLSMYIHKKGYQNKVTMQTRPVALDMLDGQPVGGREVPFSPSQQIAYNSETESLYSYWTGSSKIAKLSSTLDTLATIPMDLPTQKLSDAAYDSLEAETRDRQWKTLKDKLPDIKTPVERILIDTKGRFWLKLNYRGNTQKWLIMNQDGGFQKVVHLPRGSMLTHISEHHLGVRLDNTVFALFEPVE